MKHNIIKIRPISLALMLAGIGLAPAAFGANLVAIQGTWTSDDNVAVPMWGFAEDTGQLCNSAPTWDVGPQLTDSGATPAVVAGELTITLRNCLTEDTSLVIAGKAASSCNGAPCVPTVVTDPQGRTRATSFTSEATRSGGLMTYVWTGIDNGTYLYQSGSHPAKQVQMGLYGAVTVGTYGDAHDELTLLYSEIDPELHTTPAAATPLGYNPSYFLVNGKTSESFPAAGDTNHPTLLRFLNAGLDFHVPALNTGYMELVAEDGNAYPFPKRQYSANLAAGKTIDALWHAPAAGDYVIYDRRGNGMAATLTAAAGVGQPIANDDTRNTPEDTVKRIFRQNLYSNDRLADGVTPINGTFPNNAANREDVFVSYPSNGSLERLAAACVDTNTPCFSASDYTPNPDFNGEDTFTYKFRASLDGITWTPWSNVATVTMNVTPVNDLPVANDIAYDVTAGATLNVAALGVLVNDTDVDGDALNAVLGVGPTNGALTLNADGSFSYDSTGAAAATTESFTYFANDGTASSTLAATVSLNIIAATNSAPVAVLDAATVQRNSGATFINLTDNDYDVDGNLKDAAGFVTNGNPLSGDITITTGTLGTRGGLVEIVSNGVNFTPKRNFRGTDTFSYTVTDTSGAVSNEVSVRVNVVK